MPAGLAQRLASPVIPTREQLLETALRNFMRLAPYLGPKPNTAHHLQGEVWAALVRAETDAVRVLAPEGERG